MIEALWKVIRLLWVILERLRVQGRYDVGEDVLDLTAHGKKDDDDHDGHEHEDQGVLHHALAFLFVKESAQLPDEIGHF
jgi:hypothetical protein